MHLDHVVGVHAGIPLAHILQEQRGTKVIIVSGGGIGVTVTTIYKPGTVLSLTLLLPDQVRFKSSIEVLWLDPLPLLGDAYRLHARFVGMTSQNREQLIRYIVRFQRDHLQEHYSV